MTAFGCSQNDLESRYAHLLQPIRDLAQNWDIDLTSSLENYLSEIEKVVISFDGGLTTMNFSEAALLIQGSACVYGRKVEYLYSLVCEVNNLVSSNKKQQNQSQKETSSDPDVNNVNDDQEFLSLDDVQELRNITLKTDADQATNVEIVPPTPTVLMPTDDFQRFSTPLVGRNGEVIGGRNDFHMNTANIHSSTGCALLDLTFASLIGLMTPIHPVSQVAVAGDGARRQSLTADVADDHVIDEGCASDMSHASDDFALPGSDDNNQAEPQVAPEENAVRKSTRLDAAAKSKAVAYKLSTKKKDCWQLLDPHEADLLSTLKTYKSGKVTRLPPKLIKASDVNNKKKRKVDVESFTAFEKKLPITLMEFCNKEYFSRMNRIPSNPLKTLHCAEFEDLYWIEMKKLKDHQREIYERRRAENEDDQRGDDNMPVSKTSEVPAAVDNGNDDYDCGDDDGGDGFQIPDAVFSNAATQLGGHSVDDIAENSDHFDSLANVDIVGSYEELVRRHVECFMASAQQFVQDSALGKRVAEWQERLLPRLREEEERRVFDIHVYGREMLDRLEELNGDEEPALFLKAAEGKPQYEVCRYFLASLQLANDRNVEIFSRGNSSEGINTMKLKLLSRRQHCDSIAHYQAPSLTHQEQSQPSSQSQKTSQSQKSSAPKKRR